MKDVRKELEAVLAAEGVNTEWLEGLDTSKLSINVAENVLNKLLNMRSVLGPWDLEQGTYNLVFDEVEVEEHYTRLLGIAVAEDGTATEVAQMFWHYSNKKKELFNNTRFILPMLKQVNIPAAYQQRGMLGIVYALATLGKIECQAKVIANPDMVSKDRNGHEFCFDLTKKVKTGRQVRKLK